MKRKRVFHTIHSPKIIEPLRLAVASDLHNRPFDDVMEDFITCDGILVPGDLVNRHTGTYQEAERFLLEIPKIAPVFYSLGNHERKCTFRDEWKKIVNRSHVILLDDESTRFHGICIGGLSSRAERKANVAFLDRFEKEQGFRLLMCHHPEIYRDYVSGRNIDFTVCGHAHGGQIQIFGRGLYSPGQGFFPKLTHGLHDGGKMLISRGMSNVSGIPRINNPCELIILSLEPERKEKLK